MTWNEKRERIIAAAELGDATPRVSVDLLVDARNRAFNAEQTAKKVQAELDALKAAHAWIKTSERMPENGAKVLAIVRDAMILVHESDAEFAGVPWRTENADMVFTKGAVLKWMPIPGDE